MAMLAKGARVMPPRMHRAYRLEMSGRTLLTLLSLLTLTGLVVFYLGVVTGKGLRDPNPPVTANGPAGTSAAGAAPGALTFNQALTAPNPQIEGLKTEQSALAQKTQNLINQSRQEVELVEVPTKTPLASAPPAPPMGTAVKSAPAAAVASAKPAAALPATPPAAPKVAPATLPAAPKPAAKPAAAGEEYTVQVFSSTQQHSAQDLMASLKKKGFPAYLNQFQDADRKTWYRVRVGKGSKAEADSLANRLKRDGDIKSPRVMKL